MDTLSSIKKPSQDRSRERVEKVIATAGQLLLDVGPERTSIPEIARLSGVPRSSIYQFFPNKYALFLSISNLHLKQIAGLVKGLGEDQPQLGIEELAGRTTRVVGDYYNAHPVAGVLILGGPTSREAYLAQETTLQEIAGQLRGLFAMHLPGLSLPNSPDVMMIAVEIAFACLRHGYFTEARISDTMVEQAAVAAIAYLQTWNQ